MQVYRAYFKIVRRHLPSLAIYLAISLILFVIISSSLKSQSSAQFNETKSSIAIMTVYKAVANEAVVTVDLTVAILNGQKPDAGLIKSSNWKFDCAYDTKSYNNGNGIVPSYLLNPIVVTKDNLQKELIDTGYYTMEGRGAGATFVARTTTFHGRLRYDP